MPNKSSVCRRLAIDLRAFYVDVVEMRIPRISRNAARIDAARRTARSRTTNHADIINGCAVQHTKKAGIIDARDIDVLNAEEVAVQLPLERVCRITEWCMCVVLEIDIVLEHIVARAACVISVNRREFGFRTDELIVIVCRRCSCAVDLIVRRCGHTAALISDMGIAAVCRIRVKHDGTCRRMHVCRIEKTNVLAVYLDGIRRDVLSHIDDIGETYRRTERRYIVRHISSGVYRGDRLRGDMEMPDVDHGRLAEDDAVRIDDIDIVAALDLAVDVRGVRTRDDVQIVVRLIATIILNELTLIDGVIAPVDNIVRRCCCDLRRVRRIAVNRNTRCVVMLARRSCISDLWNQKSTRHACDEGIAHPLR